MIPIFLSPEFNFIPYKNSSISCRVLLLFDWSKQIQSELQLGLRVCCLDRRAHDGQEEALGCDLVGVRHHAYVDV